MLPIQLPWMSGSFMPRKMSAICAGDLLPQLPCQERRSFCRCASLCTRVNSNSIPNTGEVPFPSRKFVSPASRTHFFSTTPDPHISGMNKKSLLRYSGPWAVSIGAKFQFQKDTFWKELLFFKESMKRWVSAVVSQFQRCPAKVPVDHSPRVDHSPCPALASKIYSRLSPSASQVTWLPCKSSLLLTVEAQ